MIRHVRKQCRDGAAIVDVISAEDIGRFPDQNVAGSLQRVTGVQVTRSSGEANKVSVRGLSYDVSDRLALTIDGSNLTNSPLQTYNVDGYALTYEDDGRRFTFGARYRF